MSDETARPGVLFDVDGTLLDTNYLHVVTWWEALQDDGYHDVTMAQIHEAVGMGGAGLVAHLTGEQNQHVVDRHSELYAPYQGSVRAFPRAAELLARCRAIGLTVVLATSGEKSDLDWMVPAIGADDVLRGAITSGDVNASKPAPDLLTKALEEHCLDPGRTAVVGDTVWDAAAAQRADLPYVALQSGGIAKGKLLDAGAVEIYDDPADLLARLTSSFLHTLV